MSISQSRITIAVFAVLLPLLFGSPAFAAKNNYGFAQSLEGIRKAHDNYCANLLLDLKTAQGLAEDNAGTPEGDGFSAAADKAYAKAEEAGCKWATW